VLASEVSVEGVQPRGDGGLGELRAVTSGERGPVLDWRFVGLMA
jgi:hypothetical protein